MEFARNLVSITTPKEPDLSALYEKSDQHDKELKSMIGGEGLLSTVPYFRQEVYFAAVLGISGWTPADVDLAYDYVSYYGSVLTAQIELDKLELIYLFNLFHYHYFFFPTSFISYFFYSTGL